MEMSENPFCKLRILAVLSEINCRVEPKKPCMAGFELEILRRYLETMSGIYFSENLAASNCAERRKAFQQLEKLTAHLTALEVQDQKKIAFGGLEPKEKALYHANRFCGLDFTSAEYNVTVSVIEPTPTPKNRDISESPVVRTTFEPLPKKETAVFQEELKSISALELGQRIVSKRYQFNGVHGNYLHSKLIVTETPEEKKENPFDDDIEIVEDPKDSSTWWRRPQQQQKPLNISALVNKFNKRRHA